MTDGAEINFWGSDPLAFDPDNDGDLFYHFNDCDDEDPMVNPGRPEILNGIDDNCDSMADEGFNFTDSDGDGLFDWPEYHTHLTDHLDSDSDDDGLNDGIEVLTHQSNPNLPDSDDDEDGWYWFQDCDDQDEFRSPGLSEVLDGIDNDCDDIMDDGFESIDTDGDLLSDFEEYHNLSTNPYNGDTDGDGLPDGYEIQVTKTDPILADPDDDGDGEYWFDDCDDQDEERAGYLTESLDGKDNDCDEDVDEDFVDIDSDSDGLKDYDEFHFYLTSPTNSDTDGDGYLDGEEIIEMESDPLVFNIDGDSDGFLDFEDCNDSAPTINPDSSESWNGIDDDCDEMIDEDISRLELVSIVSNVADMEAWNSKDQSLEILIEDIPEGVEYVIGWRIGDYSLEGLDSGGKNVSIPSLDCDSPSDNLEVYLCKEGTGSQNITASMIDSGEITEVILNFEMIISKTPASISEKVVSFVLTPLGIAVTIASIASLLGVGYLVGARIAYRRELKEAYQFYQISPGDNEAGSGKMISEGNDFSYSLPSAPDLSSMISASNRNQHIDQRDIPPPPPPGTY